MKPVQLIFDNDGHLELVTCREVIAFESSESHNGKRNSIVFTCNSILHDPTDGFISLPDEVIARFQEHNIDAEHKALIVKNKDLVDNNERLEYRIHNLRKEIEDLSEELALYERTVREIMDECPELMSRIALKRGDLDVALYWLKQKNIKENNQ